MKLSELFETLNDDPTALECVQLALDHLKEHLSEAQSAYKKDTSGILASYAIELKTTNDLIALLSHKRVSNVYNIK